MVLKIFIILIVSVCFWYNTVLSYHVGYIDGRASLMKESNNKITQALKLEKQ